MSTVDAGDLHLAQQDLRRRMGGGPSQRLWDVIVLHWRGLRRAHRPPPLVKANGDRIRSSSTPHLTRSAMALQSSAKETQLTQFTAFFLVPQLEYVVSWVSWFGLFECSITVVPLFLAALFYFFCAPKGLLWALEELHAVRRRKVHVCRWH